MARKWVSVITAVIGNPINEASHLFLCAANPALTPEGLVLGGKQSCFLCSPVCRELFLPVNHRQSSDTFLRVQLTAETSETEKLQSGQWKTLQGLCCTNGQLCQGAVRMKRSYRTRQRGLGVGSWLKQHTQQC